MPGGDDTTLDHASWAENILLRINEEKLIGTKLRCDVRYID
jgi:hypothetical protein